MQNGAQMEQCHQSIEQPANTSGDQTIAPSLTQNDEYQDIAISIDQMYKYYEVVYQRLPTLILNVNSKIQETYEQLSLNTNKQALYQLLQHMNQPEMELEDPQLKSINRVPFNQINQLLEQAQSFTILLDRFQHQLQQSNSANQRPPETIKIKFKQQLRTIDNSPNLTSDYMIQPIINNDFNQTALNSIESYHIPTKHQIKHIYSIVLLQGKYVGLAFGQHIPYEIYDYTTKQCVQSIAIDKNSVFDSIELPNGNLVLACLRNLKVFKFDGNQYIEDALQFQMSLCTPSKILYCSSNESILSCDYQTQLQDNSYINQWSLSTGQLVKYTMSGKSTGSLALIHNESYFMAGESIQQAQKRIGRINIWKLNDINTVKVLKVGEPVYSLMQVGLKLIGLGSCIYLWNIKTYSLKTVKFPGQTLNSLSFMKLSPQKLLIGDTDGKLWQCDQDLNNWQQVLKMGSKIMKISSNNNTIAICSYDAYFTIFSII